MTVYTQPEMVDGVRAECVYDSDGNIRTVYVGGELVDTRPMTEGEEVYLLYVDDDWRKTANREQLLDALDDRIAQLKAFFQLQGVKDFRAAPNGTATNVQRDAILKLTLDHVELLTKSWFQSARLVSGKLHDISDSV